MSRRGHMEDGQRGGGTAWPRQDEQQPEEPESTEVFAFVSQGVRVRACVCAWLCFPAGSVLHPTGSAPAASLPIPPAPAWPGPPSPAWPGPQPFPGLALGLHGGFAACGAGGRGCGFVWLGFVCWRRRGRGRRGCRKGGVSQSPAASSAGTWEMLPAPSPGLPRSTAWWLGEKEKGRVGREPPHPSPC